MKRQDKTYCWDIFIHVSKLWSRLTSWENLHYFSIQKDFPRCSKLRFNHCSSSQFSLFYIWRKRLGRTEIGQQLLHTTHRSSKLLLLKVGIRYIVDSFGSCCFFPLLIFFLFIFYSPYNFLFFMIFLNLMNKNMTSDLGSDANLHYSYSSRPKTTKHGDLRERPCCPTLQM